MTTEELARRVLATVPCVCDAAYYERALVAPDCCHHDVAEDTAAAGYVCICAACARLARYVRKHEPERQRRLEKLRALGILPPVAGAV